MSSIYYENRTSRRCVKSPGGECHDLFGAEFNGSPSHNRVLKPPGGGSSDLFGLADEQQQPKPVPRKNNSNFTSNLVITDEVPVTNGQPKENGVAKSCNGRVVGECAENGVSKMNGESGGKVASQTDGAVTNGNAGPRVQENGAAKPRQRVPPGGYSSGLW